MSTHGETGTATRFSIRRDIKHVQWKPTFQVMFVRAVGVAVVFSIIFAFMLLQDPSYKAVAPSGILMIFFVFFMGAIFTATFIYPTLGVISWYLASLYTKISFFGFFGIFYIVFTLPLIFADPVIFFVHKMKPQWVPVEKYKFINLAPVVFVLNPEYMDRLCSDASGSK